MAQYRIDEVFADVMALGETPIANEGTDDLAEIEERARRFDEQYGNPYSRSCPVCGAGVGRYCFGEGTSLDVGLVAHRERVYREEK